MILPDDPRSLDPPPPRFRPGPLAAPLSAICAAIYLLAASEACKLRPVLIWRDLGILALGLLVSTGLAWVAWRCDPRRKAGGAVFCLLMFLLAMGRVGERSLDRAEIREHTAQLWNYADAVHRKEAEVLAARRSGIAPASRPPDEASALVGQGINLVQKAAGDLSGDDRKMMEAEARILGTLRTRTQAVERAVAELSADGWASTVGLSSREAIARRRALVRHYADVNDSLIGACRNLEATARTEMYRELPAPRAEEGVRTVMAAMDLGPALRMRECEGRRIEALGQLMALYDEQFPHWRLDAGKRVLFDDAAAVPVHKRWREQMDAALAEETRLLQEMVARHQASSAASGPAAP